jgi:heptose I phosphotransferase
MQIYSGLPLRIMLKEQAGLWREVESRAQKLLAE